MSSATTDVHRKTWAQSPVGFFEAESAGLRWLAEAEPLGGARIVGVRSVGPHHIDLERLVPASPTPQASGDFGRALAVTHELGAPAFGAPPHGWTGDAWIGRQSQTNDPVESWGLFYAEQRVRPFVRRAVDAGHLDPAGAGLVETVCDRIAAGIYDDGRPPARIHGDLWAGNAVFTASGVVLIDPAAHGGHGLTDIAMLALFGAPGLDHICTAYAETADLQRDWRRHIALHQLHPLATHAASHGPGYASQLVDAARSVR